MKYKILDTQLNSYFSNGDTFNTLEDIEERLREYHSVDVEEINTMSFDDICSSFGWKIVEVEE